MLSVPLHQHYHKWKNEQKDIDLAQTCGIIIEMLWTEISRKGKFHKNKWSEALQRCDYKTKCKYRESDTNVKILCYVFALLKGRILVNGPQK